MLEFVSKDARTVVYKTDDPRELSDKKLASLDWVKTVPRLKVLLPGKLRGVHEILRRSISAKYTVRVVYSMQTKDLQVPKVVCPKRAVKLVEYADPQAAKSLFINTQSRFFLAPWSERIDHAYLTSLAEFLKNLLPQTKSARIEINGQSVGLVTVYKQDEGTDQIAWIWLLIVGPGKKYCALPDYSLVARVQS